MKNLLAYLPALLIFFSSCATPQRCAKYCTGNDSTIITVHDTVVQVQIVPDTAAVSAPAPCPDIAPVTVQTANARARAWISDSTLHVEASQYGTASAMVEYRDMETIRYRYINIPCPDYDMARWKYLFYLLLSAIVIAVLIFFKS